MHRFDLMLHGLRTLFSDGVSGGRTPPRRLLIRLSDLHWGGLIPAASSSSRRCSRTRATCCTWATRPASSRPPRPSTSSPEVPARNCINIYNIYIYIIIYNIFPSGSLRFPLGIAQEYIIVHRNRTGTQVYNGILLYNGDTNPHPPAGGGLYNNNNI